MRKGRRREARVTGGVSAGIRESKSVREVGENERPGTWCVGLREGDETVARCNWRVT